MVKFFTGLSIEAWIVIACGVLALGAWGVFEYRGASLQKAEKTIVTQAVQIASQKDAIEVDKKVAKIEESTQVATAVAVKDTTVKHEQLAKKVANADRVITQHFDQLPVTVENVDAEQHQLSENRINGLWESFCAGSPDAKGCEVTPTPAGDNHA